MPGRVHEHRHDSGKFEESGNGAGGPLILCLERPFSLSVGFYLWVRKSERCEQVVTGQSL